VVRRSGGVAQLVDRSEDDTSGSVEIGLEDLDHGDALSIKLQDTTFGSGRSIVYCLGQFDNVELHNFLSYCHQTLMLGARIGGDQPWRTVSVGVVPRNYYRSTPIVHGEFNLDSAGDAMWAAVAHDSDLGSNYRLGKIAPKKFPFGEADMEHLVPFRAMSGRTKDPVFDLPPFEPSVLGPRKGFSNFWRPLHLGEAMEPKHTCVCLGSIHRGAGCTRGARR
jgi:hypothetical protein